jgi:DivIVA domain-containing protein
MTIFDPEEIALKRFVIRWRGYDTREVETFLRAVAVDFRRLIDRTATRDELLSAEGQFADVRDDLHQLLSRVDQAVAQLEPPHPGDPAEQAELRLVQGGTGGA